MIELKEFRSVFYMRTGKFSRFFKWIMPPMPGLFFCCPSIGGGIFIQHGWYTRINAESVGKNLWVNQNVTIGWNDHGRPTIGDNVRIGVGAVIIGPVKIGNNVNIGANAIVVDDIPSNTTVCSPKARIVKESTKPTANARMMNWW